MSEIHSHPSGAATSIRALLSGSSPNGTPPEVFPEYRDIIEILTLAHASGGVPKVREAWRDLVRRHPDLAGLISADPFGSRVTTGNHPEPFPTHVLPKALVPLVQEGAQSLSCPRDLIGLPILVLAGAAIGTSRAIQIKHGWREGPRMYGTVVAEPGAVKSPAPDLVARPFYIRQQILLEEYRKQEQDYQAAMAHHEVELQVWKERIRKAARGESHAPGRAPALPAAPTLARLFTADATVEALAVLLQANPRGLGLIRDGFALKMAGASNRNRLPQKSSQDNGW